MGAKKIALLGTAESSAHLAPYADKDWEIWGCSTGTMNQPRISRRFEIHRWNPTDQTRWPQAYVDYLRRYDGPIYMAKEYPDIPNCVVLPWKYLVRKYSPYFFTSSIAWMFAMAIEEQPEAIHLYGIDMGAMQEYKDQRMGLQYFAMIAQSQGIDVYAPPEADVFAPAPLYGICETSHQWWKQRGRLIWLTKQANELAQEIETKTSMLRHIQGSLDEQDYNFRSWFGNEGAMSEDFTKPAECSDLSKVIHEIDLPEALKQQAPLMELDIDSGKAAFVTAEGEPSGAKKIS